MLFTLALAAVCVVLLCCLVRTRRTCNELEKLYADHLKKYLTESEQRIAMYKTADRLMYSVNQTMTDIRFILASWNHAPEYAAAHSDELARLASAYAATKSALSDWLHHMKLSGASDTEMQRLYIRLNARALADDGELLALYSRLGITGSDGYPYPERVCFALKANARIKY